MGLAPNASVDGGEYLEGMLTDYPRTKSTARHIPAFRFVTALTCLQFAFAMYATFLLYYLSPTINLRTKPDFAWAARMAQSWKQFIVRQPHAVGRYQLEASATGNLLLPSVLLKPAEVCEGEEILFEQKKSNDTGMIKFKRELYDEVMDFQSKTFGVETLSQLMRMI